MVDLTVEFAGIKFKNPIFVGSGPPTTTFEQLKVYADAGASAVDTKIVATFPPHPSHRRILYDKKSGAVFWQMMRAGDEALTLDEAVTLIKRVKQELGIPVFGNMMGFTENPKEWVEIAQLLEDAGADLIHTALGEEVITPWRIPIIEEIPEKIIKPLCESVKIPVMVKLSPYMSFRIPAISKACEKAGVKALSTIDAYFGLPPLNIEEGGKPAFLSCDKQLFPAGVSGPWLKPMTYWCTYQAANSVNIPVSAVGGITDTKDVIEAMMYGAKTVQVMTSIILKGTQIITKTIEELEKFMERNGYNKIDDFVGLANQHIVSSITEFNLPHAVIEIEETKCNGCGLCALPAHCNAISIKDDMAQLESNLCKGCALCVYLCNRKAITLKRV